MLLQFDGTYSPKDQDAFKRVSADTTAAPAYDTFLATVPPSPQQQQQQPLLELQVEEPLLAAPSSIISDAFAKLMQRIDTSQASGTPNSARRRQSVSEQYSDVFLTSNRNQQRP